MDEYVEEHKKLEFPKPVDGNTVIADSLIECVVRRTGGVPFYFEPVQTETEESHWIKLDEIKNQAEERLKGFGEQLFDVVVLAEINFAGQVYRYNATCKKWTLRGMTCGYEPM